MVLNIESCSEGRKGGRGGEGRGAATAAARIGWDLERAVDGAERGERERELHRRIGDAKSSHQIGLTRLYYPHGS